MCSGKTCLGYKCHGCKYLLVSYRKWVMSIQRKVYNTSYLIFKIKKLLKRSVKELSRDKCPVGRNVWGRSVSGV